MNKIKGEKAGHVGGGTTGGKKGGQFLTLTRRGVPAGRGRKNKNSTRDRKKRKVPALWAWESGGGAKELLTRVVTEENFCWKKIRLDEVTP